MDCTCEKCQRACQNHPGWFMPGEAEKVAEYLGMSLPDLFRKKLGVDWYEADETHEQTIYLLAPATTMMESGGEYPVDPNGACIFYQFGRCTIHPVKPFECRMYDHTQSREETQPRHESVAVAWEGYQEQIVALLGREPEPKEMTIFDLFRGDGAMEDLSNIIELLKAENELLRASLHDSPSRELQIAAGLNVLMKELVQLGPQATARVLTWALERHMRTGGTFHQYQFWDRRPKKEEIPPQPSEPERRIRLRKARVAAGLSQGELARRANLPQPYLSEIELGKKDPPEATWERLEATVSEPSVAQ